MGGMVTALSTNYGEGRGVDHAPLLSSTTRKTTKPLRCEPTHIKGTSPGINRFASKKLL